jgi:hypothetical protein
MAVTVHNNPHSPWNDTAEISSNPACISHQSVRELIAAYVQCCHKYNRPEVDTKRYRYADIFIYYLSTPQNGLSSLSSLITTRYHCDIDLPHFYWNFHPFSFVCSIQPPNTLAQAAKLDFIPVFGSNPDRA